MTELVDATDQDEMIGSMTTDIVDQNQLVEQLLEQAKEQNIELVGPDGLLGQLTKNVLETALTRRWASTSAMRSTIRRVETAGQPQRDAR